MRKCLQGLAKCLAWDLVHLAKVQGSTCVFSPTVGESVGGNMAPQRENRKMPLAVHLPLGTVSRASEVGELSLPTSSAFHVGDL